MKKKNLIIVVVIIIIIISLISLGVYFLIKFQKKLSLPPREETKPKTSEAIVGEEAPIPPQVENEALLKEELKRRARSFIERYGSFSSDARGRNLEELLPLMTENFKAKTQEKISAIKSQPTSEVYYSLVTKVISLKLTDFSDFSANFKANVQQEEIKNGISSVSYKEAEITFLKEAEDWKIDNLEFK